MSNNIEQWFISIISSQLEEITFDLTVIEYTTVATVSLLTTSASSCSVKMTSQFWPLGLNLNNCACTEGKIVYLTCILSTSLSPSDTETVVITYQISKYSI